ncbi:Cytidine and deoxycytidylate deaminase zinc-binding region [Dyadobacter sp. SG02]|uniref:nucleoside deaminase n=1 Tax=Dyadobacter sp. SG02 TaxID=1855291 RepID=UPI0008C89E0A|nr:nucleoside deaminase [Dyadobacter sp. SG02]SEJ75530.1 Cytidine and deoxycytidylate deaminase zinc-binding region [Dyadobacter sp. SG02]
MKHKTYMKRAMKLSVLAQTSGKGLPVGCVIARNGLIVAEGHNEVLTQQNPTAHAEIVVIGRACKTLQRLSLEDCVLYTTVEPCPMCMSAIYWANVKEVYYAIPGMQAAAVGFDDSFILQELFKERDQQAIPVKYQPLDEAFDVLRAWQDTDKEITQHWSGS